MLVANGSNLRIELEDETIRCVSNRSRAVPFRQDFKLSSVVDVSWKEPGFLNGFILFVPPGSEASDTVPALSKRGDGYVFFGRERRDEFRAIYDAVIGSIQDARRLGAHLNAVFKPGEDRRLHYSGRVSEKLEFKQSNE